MGKKDLSQFDPQKLAQLDMEMWRAYYEHRFYKLFRLLLHLLRAQFGLGRRLALKGAFYAAVAATDYRLHYKRENFARVERSLVRLYKLMSDNCSAPFDYKKAAHIELEWWNIHRYPNKYDKTLDVSLAEGAAAIYNGAPKDFLTYGKHRAEAMLLRDRTGDAPDWDKIESMLVTSWQSLHSAVQSNKH